MLESHWKTLTWQTSSWPVNHRHGMPNGGWRRKDEGLGGVVCDSVGRIREISKELKRKVDNRQISEAANGEKKKKKTGLATGRDLDDKNKTHLKEEKKRKRKPRSPPKN